eukprot:g55642.t1
MEHIMQLPSIHSRSRVHSRSPERRLVTGSKSPTNILSLGRTSICCFLSGGEEHTVQRLQPEGPSIPLRSSPSSSLSSSIDASGTRCLDEPLSRVVSHRRVWWLPFFLWFFSFHSRCKQLTTNRDRRLHLLPRPNLPFHLRSLFPRSPVSPYNR